MADTTQDQRSRARRYDAPRFIKLDDPESNSSTGLALIGSIVASPKPEDTGERSSTPPEKPKYEGLTGADFITAYLGDLGWNFSDIARILVGPNQSHLTAETLYRQLAASTPDQKGLFLALFQKAGGQDTKQDPTLLAGLDKDHLKPAQTTGIKASELIKAFADLPDLQKRRFLSLLQSETLTNPEIAFAPPKKSTGSPDAKPADVTPAIVKSSLETLQALIKALAGGIADKAGRSGTVNSGPGKGGSDEGDSDKSGSGKSSGSMSGTNKGRPDKGDSDNNDSDKGDSDNNDSDTSGSDTSDSEQDSQDQGDPFAPPSQGTSPDTDSGDAGEEPYGPPSPDALNDGSEPD